MGREPRHPDPVQTGALQAGSGGVGTRGEPAAEEVRRERQDCQWWRFCLLSYLLHRPPATAAAYQSVENGRIAPSHSPPSESCDDVEQKSVGVERSSEPYSAVPGACPCIKRRKFSFQRSWRANQKWSECHPPITTFFLFSIGVRPPVCHILHGIYRRGARLGPAACRGLAAATAAAAAATKRSIPLK